MHAMSAWRAAIMGALCALLVGALGVVGFVVGQSSRTTVRQAATSEASARVIAYEATWRLALARGHELGYAQGRAAARAAGAKAGARAGRSDGARFLASQTTTSASSQASNGCPAGLVAQGTQACVLPGTASVGGQSAGCAGDPYSTPDRYGGCIGPAAPPSAANAGPATSCPAGQVPAGSAGACAPTTTTDSGGATNGGGGGGGGTNSSNCFAAVDCASVPTTPNPPTCVYTRGYSASVGDCAPNP